ncbi:MAG: CoA transferase [Actinomycetia bacterium]|nr:CoA transferase [Actinomycetes bacterium]
MNEVEANEASLPGLRVIDASQVMAGPYCAMLLADHGADVIKVEPPTAGDATRSALGDIQAWGESAAFLAVNRNKRSLTINLKDERGQDVFHALAQTADVLIESYRPGTAERLGIGYEALAAVNPRLVYASISGFGASGPSAKRGGYDIITQGASGIMSVTGEPGADPAKAGVPLTDIGAGTLCAFGILAALIARAQTGEGQLVDTSLFEAGLVYGAWEATELWSSGRLPGPLGSAHRLSAPYQAIRTGDGHITIGAFTDRLWQQATQVFGRPEWIDDPRFATGQSRLRHRAELVELIEEVTLTKPGGVWLERLHAAGVPAGPVNNYEQAFADPQTVAREMVVEAEHPQAGTIRMVGIPLKLSETPGSIRRPPPMLGQHTDELLVELGYTGAQRASLRADGVV